jgi:hypothetical protein
VPLLQAGLKAYFPFYNEERPHQALDYRTPAQVYRASHLTVAIQETSVHISDFTAPQPYTGAHI